MTDDFWIYGAAEADDTYYLIDTRWFDGDVWYGTIDVRAMLERMWLPTNNVGTGNNREYLLALPGYNLAGNGQLTVSSTSTITLAALKSRVAAVNAELNKPGGTVAERRECLKGKYKTERILAHGKLKYGREPVIKDRYTDHGVGSGAPAGTVVFKDSLTATLPDFASTTTTWIEGDNLSLFKFVDDTRSLDENVSNTHPEL